MTAERLFQGGACSLPHGVTFKLLFAKLIRGHWVFSGLDAVQSLSVSAPKDDASESKSGATRNPFGPRSRTATARCTASARLANSDSGMAPMPNADNHQPEEKMR